MNKRKELLEYFKLMMNEEDYDFVIIRKYDIVDDNNYKAYSLNFSYDFNNKKILMSDYNFEKKVYNTPEEFINTYVYPDGKKLIDVVKELEFDN